MFTTVDKALTPLGVGIVYWLLSLVHVTPQMTVEQMVTLLVSSIGVYFASNKK